MRLGMFVTLIALALPLGVITPAPTLGADAPPSLVGLWRIDPTRSDLSRKLRGPLGRPDGMPRSESKGPSDGPGSHRPGRLPDLLRITEKNGHLFLADSTGIVVQEIAINGQAAAAPASGATTLELAGKWKDGHLDVERPGWRGNLALDSWSLGEGGATLLVETKMTGTDALPGFQTRRVYLKVKES